MIVVSCFDRTGNMVKPWADAGYRCHLVDIAHPAGVTTEGNIVRHGVDIRRWLPPLEPVAAAFFFPPCTDLAVSGARWFAGKGLFALAEAIEMFAHAARLAEHLGAPYLIENPVSTISTYWREPDHTFDPCDYAGYPGGSDDLYTKPGQVCGPGCDSVCGRCAELIRESGWHDDGLGNLRAVKP